MSSFIITTDNGSDLSRDLIKKLKIDIINLTINVDGEEYNGIDKVITPETIYSYMKKGVVPYTSQVNPEKAEQFFESYLKNGYDIIHICLSGQISGTYNSCKIAQTNLKEKYPDRKVAVIDSLSGSLGQGLLVLEAVKERDNGKTFEEVEEFIKNRRYNIIHIFTVESLSYLQKSGRISKTESVIGSFIGVKPILSANNHGRIIQIDKVRGRKNSISYLIDKIKRHIDLNSDQILAIAHCGCLKEAQVIKTEIETNLKVQEVIIKEMGPVLGAHAGPGAIAVFFVADKRLG